MRSSDTSVSAGGRPGLDDEDSKHLQVLGLPPGSAWEDVRRAHAALVADLTPGPDASHGNVALAHRLLEEVNQAYTSLRAQISVA